jgi:hypothetical protein
MPPTEDGETLKPVLTSVQVPKYTFTGEVRLQPRVRNGGFPVLMLNVCLADSVAFHRLCTGGCTGGSKDAEDAGCMRRWKEISLHALMGLLQSAETKYSRYRHLVDCNLKIQAGRGPHEGAGWKQLPE